MTDLPESTFFALSRHGAVVELMMNRPDKANGMNPDFWADLPRIVAALDADPSVRAIVLTGAGKHFSSGMDLTSFAEIHTLLSQEPGRAAHALRDLIKRLQRAVSALEETRLPVVAAVHGACLGGALDLICACDIRLAAEDARFGIEEINIGMAADIGTLQRLPRLIPGGLVAELALTGRRFDATEAARWGLVSSVHTDAAAAREAALDIARSIASKSPLAVSGTKRALIHGRDHTVADGLDQIATWNAGMLRAEDMMAAIQARMAKSDAAFKDLLGPV